MTVARAHGRRPGRVATVTAVGTTVVVAVPVFLVSGLAVQIEGDIGLTTALLGVVVALYWAAATVFSGLGGRVAQRFGSRVGMVASLVLGCAAVLGIALAAPSWPLLIPWLALAGAANALGQPPSNMLIASRVSVRNRALAFGLKQSSIPIATLLAGAFVPLLGLTVGWRWSFAAVAVLPLAVVPLVLRTVPAGLGALPVAASGEEGRIGGLRRFLLPAAAATTLGSAQANVIGTYTVSTAAAAGVGPGAAGLLLSLASAAGILARPLVGLAADRGRGGSLATVAVMLGVGAVGLLGMAWGRPWSLALGCVLAFGFGWGWNGLVHYVVSAVAYPYSARATGFVQTGAYFGSGAGPLVFGFVFAGAGATTGWALTAAVALAAAALALFAHLRDPRRVGS
jgi:predicted MFS family arabinose efflux permease